MKKIEINLDRFKKATPVARYIHSPAHQFADELCQLFQDKKHFGLYLKLALKHDHSFLRRIASQVSSNPNATNKGRLFTYLVSKELKELTQEKL